MKTRNSLLLAFLFSGLVISCTRYECPEPEPPTEVNTYTLKGSSQVMDAYVSNASSGTGNNEYLATLGWTISGTPYIWRTFLQFDYSTLPANTNVHKAILTLYADTTYAEAQLLPNGHTGSNAWLLSRILQPWNETTVTWNNAPTTDAVNQISLPASTSNDQAYVIDVTTLVQDEINNPSLYHGFMFQLQNESPYRSIIFYSSEAAFTHLIPKLEVQYK